MIKDFCKPINAIESDSATDIPKNTRAHKPTHRRSLSGSSVPSNSWHSQMKSVLKANKLTPGDKNKDDNSSGTVLSEMEKSVDSLSSSSGNNILHYHQKSNSSDYSEIYKNRHQRKCQSVSAKVKIKHFLSEHVARIHHCHHPEYHVNKKNCDKNISLSDLKDDSRTECCSQNSSKDVLNQRPRSDHELNLLSNRRNIASNILDRIRHINIQPSTSSVSTDLHGPIDNNSVATKKHGLETNDSDNSQNCFPNPEPNPCNLPNVISPCSIDFATKHILADKPKHFRLAHSTSYDQDYKLADICKKSNKKTLSYAMSLGPKFIPAKDKWEKKISGFLDTSTSTGATLTAINFGLKRVTETDKYLMITTSPTSCPNDFLEDGISHVEATSEIYQSLMRHSTCYDLMPDSGKVIIMDSQIEIQRAFDAIEDNIVRASPIWSSVKQSFIALLTVNDLVPLLLHLHQQKDDSDLSSTDEFDLLDFSHVTVEECLGIIPRFRSLQNHIVQVTPETNIRTVNTMFNQFSKSMLLVIDSFLSGNPLFILTGLRILTYLYYKVHTICLESCFSTKISASNLLLDQHFQILSPLTPVDLPPDGVSISTNSKIQYLIYSSASIVDVLRAMADSHYCCAMIIDSIIEDTDGGDNKYVVKHIITIADILHLIKIQKHIVPTITADRILQYQKDYNESMTYRDPVISCSINDSISNLIHNIVKEKASFVLISSTNNEYRTTVGILTVHDVLTYIDSLPYNSTELHNNFHGLSRLTKRHHNKEPENKGKSHSDVFWSNRCGATILDDFVEEAVDLKLT